MTVDDTAIAFEALHAEHRIERLVERVWTLAGCVAELACEPQEDILARLLGPPADAEEWRPAHPNRADLCRYRDDLESLAATLKQHHERRAGSMWRMLPAPAASADIGPGGPATLEVDIGKVRALGTDEGEL